MRRHRYLRRGFTLVEIMVALVVMAIIISVLAYNATATSAALGVRTGWITLGQAELATRGVAQSNTSGYYYPVLQAGTGCVSETVTGGVTAPTSSGLTFLYECASTSSTSVSIDETSTTTVAYALHVSSTACLAMVDNLASTGATTTYGLDTSFASGHCNAVNVAEVATNIVSTSTLSPTSLNGDL